MTAVADPPGPLLARLARPQSPSPVRLAVIADPHVAAGTGSWKCRHLSARLFARAVRTAERHADAVLLAGDLTGDGRRDSFATVDETLADCSVPWAAVPGNHDVPKQGDAHPGLSIGRFERRYTPGLPFTMSVGPVTVVGVDSATARDGSLRASWGGQLGPATREWLAATLPTLEGPVVLVCHHTLGALADSPGGPWANFPLRDAAVVRELVAAHDIPLVVTGHHHVPAVQQHGPTTELVCPPGCSFPQAMTLLETGPAGTTVRLVPLGTRAELATAHRAARTGKPLAVGLVTQVERRLEALPLVDAGLDDG